MTTKVKYKKVTLRISFQDLLGKNRDEIHEEIRRIRWEAWKKLVPKTEYGEWVIGCWTDTSSCEGCKYLDKDWCSYHGLPCTVNPVLSYKAAMPGMACIGIRPE